MTNKRYQVALPQGPRAAASTTIRNSSIQREQELCLDAIESGDYDSMSDKEWIELCERAAREDSPDAGIPASASDIE
mgnify:CR=1 FL=1